MKNYVLGNTGLMVSRLSFGTVYMGSRGDGLSPEAGADLLLEALNRGVNYWDTSDDYESHAHVASALRRIPRNQVVVSSKTGFPGSQVDVLLKELGTDYIDIVFAHDVEADDVERARETLISWQKQKALGKLQALGLSTHDANVASLVSEWPEVEALMLPINSPGVCLPEFPIVGGIEKMMQAAEKAWRSGKGIIAMKVMGCGVLAQNPKAAIKFVDDLPFVHSLCIGMRCLDEIEQNVRILEREPQNGRAKP